MGLKKWLPWWEEEDNTDYSYQRLEIPQDIYLKIQALTDACSVEISGFGKTKTIIDENGNKVVKVTDLQVFKQTCNGAHTALDEDDLTQMYLELIKAELDPAQYNFWWHSHVDFSVFFSGTDVATLERLSDDDSIVVGLCTNKKGDKVATIYRDGEEIREKIPVKIVSETNQDEVEQWAHDTVKRKVEIIRTVSKKGQYPKFYTQNDWREKLRKEEGYGYYD